MLLRSIDTEALELLAHLQVGKQACRVLVEVKEGSRLAVVDARLPLGQLRASAYYSEHVFDGSECLRAGMLHVQKYTTQARDATLRHISTKDAASSDAPPTSPPSTSESATN